MSPKSGFTFVGVRRVLPVFGALCLLALTQHSLRALEDDPGHVHERIAQEKKALSTAERDHLPDVRLAFGWERIALDYESAADFFNAEKAFDRSLQLLGSDADNSIRRAQVLDALGYLYLVYGRLDDARSVRSQALNLLNRSADPLQIARARSHLAEIDLVSKQYRDAYIKASQAYQVMTNLHEPIQVELISSLIVMAYAQCGLHDRAGCLVEAQRAAEMTKSPIPESEMTQSAALIALGYAELKNGEAAAAESDTRQAIDIVQKRIVHNDPRVVYALRQQRDCLLAQHNKAAAEQIRRQIEAIDRDSAASCVGCSVSVFAFAKPK